MDRPPPSLTVTCSWCHGPVRVVPGVKNLCPGCGHRGDLPRVACDCPRCGLALMGLRAKARLK